MSKQIDALKLALEALESYEKSAYIKQSHPKRWANGNKAITAIKEALAQPEQKPVAFICQGNVYMADDVDEYCTATHIPLYTKEQL